MKYYAVSTSNSGHGAVFTNGQEARKYQADHAGSRLQSFDAMPVKIPSLGKVKKEESSGPEKRISSDSDPIIVYTDGSSLNNPGPGGYGVVIQAGGGIHEFSRGYEHTTNNRMEMLAVITALEKLKKHSAREVIIHSDSQYTINGVVKGWARGWKKRNWKKSDGNPALNPDLWDRMLDLVDLFPKLSFKWVKGHAGNPLNERADDLANSAASLGVDMAIDEGYVKR